MSRMHLPIAILALVVACALAGVERAPRQHAASADAQADRVIGADGVSVPANDYQRIVTASTVADQIVVRLVEPERIAGITWWGAERLDEGFRLGAKPRIRPLEEIEPIIALSPDLVVVHNYDGDLRRIARLRDAGIAVFDCGQMRGIDDLRTSLRQLGALLRQPQRAAAAERDLTRRLTAVARHLPSAGRRGAVYVSVYGGRLFGGTRGSSFHDVLTCAGVRDQAAEAGLTGWPQYDPERLIALGPDLLVTRSGMAAELRAVPGLSSMSALAEPGRVVELPPALVEDPGFGLLPAAEALHAAVYGDGQP
jgi:iron complex transport system substrate-binding protein